MQPNTENDFTPTSEGSLDRIDQDDVGRITNAQDRTLLVALQQFILPHIGAVENEVEIGKQATHSILLKPEAIKLIAAFKEFIASVSGSVVPKESSKKGTVIRVGLHEQGGSRSESSDKVLEATHTPASKYTLWTSNQENIAGVGTPQINQDFYEKVQLRLREHVFNKMPIRLLHFIPKSTHLEISLIERGAIYAHLLSIMQAKINMLERDYQYWQAANDSEKVKLVVKTVCQYAILSHTWLREAPGEITYGDWHDQNFDQSSPGYQKLVNFCKLAWLKYRLTLGWMDTVCINKESSSELDESIRSMFKWYHGSTVCIAYLAESQFIPDIHRDRWFTRGWTLQELVAPEFIKLCNQDWDYFNPDINSSDTNRTYVPSYTYTSNKGEILNQIRKATSITATEFGTDFFRLPLSRRMQLAATREVTREEDTAYSLMGIFDVSIATAYGEGGGRAFSRLLQAILQSTSNGIFDLFNWSGRVERITVHRTALFPPSITSYAFRSAQIMDYNIFKAQPSEPLVLTPMGIRIPVVLMPGIFVNDQDQSLQPIGDYYATAQFSICDYGVYYSTFRVLDRLATVKRQYTPRELKWTLAILNIQQTNEEIVIPKTCIAKVISGDMSMQNKRKQEVIDTVNPISFEIQHKTGRGIAEWGENIPVGDLAMHGMRFMTLYL